MVGALVACTSPGSKAGPARPATVLHLATAESSSAPYAADVERFADRVAALTDGSVRVEIDYEVIDYTTASERRITDMVRAGGTDLALVPPRAFDTAGITGFEALQSPLLIDTPELAGAVATSHLAGDMLSGLSDQGLVGLGLVYEGMRRPLALNGSVTRASDFEGLLVRVPPSNLSDRMFVALGAVADHGASHTISTTGAPYPLVETELAIADNDFPKESTLTANIAFFPKYDAIVADPDAFGRLTDGQQQALRQAAADTVSGSLETTSGEEQLAATYCETGGALAFAPPAELTAIRAKVQPVVDSLREDPATAQAIEAIEALKQTTAAPMFSVPAACHPPTGDGAQLPSPPAAPTP
ncbi:MAG TPA: hypothetical protein VKB55_16725 [Nocardioidaceae bacterium]|nr:hypothetical protein [Nocardioidaceae bacterium]